MPNTQHTTGPDALDALAKALQPTPSPAVLQAIRRLSDAWRADLDALATLTGHRRPTTDRDPRTLPMPGDRMYVPVEIADVGYGRGGFDVELLAVIDGVSAFDVTVLYEHTEAGDQGVGRWLRGAVGVTAAAPPELVAAAQALDAAA